jgi:hypothetical protein
MTMGVPMIVAMVPLSMMGLWLEREYFEGIRRFKENELILQQLSSNNQQTNNNTQNNQSQINNNETQSKPVALENDQEEENKQQTETTIIDIENTTNMNPTTTTTTNMNVPVNLCSWKPLAGVGFSGVVVEEQKIWRMDLDIDNNRNLTLVYRNKTSGLIQKEKPRAVQMVEAAVKASTLMHLTHNLLAICFSLLTYVVVYTFKLNVDPSKF